MDQQDWDDINTFCDYAMWNMLGLGFVAIVVLVIILW